MDIKVQSDDKEFIFTLRQNAKECRLDLTGYNDPQTNWSSFSEQCKQPEKRKVIEIPDQVASEAKAKLMAIVTVSNKI